VGLKEEDLAAVKQFKLKAMALQFVYIVRASNSSALALCEHFLEQVEDTQRFVGVYISLNGYSRFLFIVKVYFKYLFLMQTTSVAQWSVSGYRSRGPMFDSRPYQIF
jgi:hypothetical protein